MACTHCPEHCPPTLSEAEHQAIHGRMEVAEPSFHAQFEKEKEERGYGFYGGARCVWCGAQFSEGVWHFLPAR